MSRRRTLVTASLGLVAVAGGAGWAWNAGLLSVGAGTTAAGASPSASAAPTVKTAAVTKRTLTVSEELDGTLGYAGDQEVRGGVSGTLTWLPEPGTVIEHGGRLYEVNGGKRALLLYGAVPAWRWMGPGMSDGVDVRQLEVELKALGFAPKGMEIDRHWDDDTSTAVEKLQKARGLTRDGGLSLGEIVFLPQAIRVTELTATLGSQAGPGASILRGSTSTRVVTVALDADKQELLDVGTPVTVELPDGRTTAGKVAEIGRVAQGSEEPFSTPTIGITISLDDPSAAGDLDQAPVTVSVVTDSRPGVLAVPVNALVALLEGGYAVEVQAPDGARRYVAVRLGLFQDGWVEVEATTLAAGDKIVVPS